LPAAQTPILAVKQLEVRFGQRQVLRGVDLVINAGEIFGLLGPNGAGKTTTVEILEGLRTRTSGDVRVLGFDPGVSVFEIKDRIGVALQATNLPEKITVREALNLFAAFYSRRVDQKKLLDRLQLSDKRDTYYYHLSGGQKQRLALALAMVNDPQLLFLDEPTTGLDPQVRLEIHTLIQELRSSRRTILLTTHYIEEAEKLCDRVAIVDEGKIIALGSPREIQACTLGQSRIEIRCEQPMPASLPTLVDGDDPHFSEDRCVLTVTAAKPARTIVDLVKWIDQHGLDVADIHLKRPTLEDVFIELTGKSLRE
jgi:ABC-2 type transport system ATP-binding protein